MARRHGPVAVACARAAATPLLTLFPDNGGPAQSYFWCFPGVRAMVPDDPSFAGNGSLMPSLAGNQLVDTYCSAHRQYYFTSHSYP
ncbi:MAG: hypothetical protein U1E73_00860 [Planctomycetota bacterium]